MGESEGEAIYYITKEEFIRRIKGMNKDWVVLANRYDFQLTHAKKEQDSGWFKKQIDDIMEDVRANNSMVARAGVEKGYNLFWINGEGSLLMRRCSEEEHKTVYKPRKNTSYVV